MHTADNLYVPIVMKSGSLSLLEPSGPIQGLLYLYLYLSEWEARMILPVYQHNRLGTLEVQSQGQGITVFSQTSTKPRILKFFLQGTASGVWHWPLTTIKALRLWMSGAILLLPLCALMAWTGTISPSHPYCSTDLRITFTLYVSVPWAVFLCQLF